MGIEGILPKLEEEFQTSISLSGNKGKWEFYINPDGANPDKKLSVIGVHKPDNTVVYGKGLKLEDFINELSYLEDYISMKPFSIIASGLATALTTLGLVYKGMPYITQTLESNNAAANMLYILSAGASVVGMFLLFKGLFSYKGLLGNYNFTNKASDLKKLEIFKNQEQSTKNL